MEYNLSELAVILLDSLGELEYKHKVAILKLYGSPSEIFERADKAANFLSNMGCDCLSKNFLRRFSYENGAEILKKLDDENVTAVTFLSADYPEIFKHMQNAPLVLYCRGDRTLLNAPKKIGIVGSRKTLPFVLKKCEQISESLAGAGCVIVSGTAIGGDRSALSGAIKNGKAISVIASGFDNVSPQSNRDLLSKVEQNGLLLSEYPPDTQPAAWRYPMRNRIIAALSDAVFVVSGDADSGTRYTVQYAEAFSKRIYAFPYSIGERSGTICNHLIKMGKANLVEEAEDLAEGEGIDLSATSEVALEPEEAELAAVLDGEKTVDEIVEITGKRAYEILPVLSMLEIKGVCSRGAGNTWVVIKNNKKR